MTPTPQPSTPSRALRRAALCAIALALTALAAGCGGGSDEPSNAATAAPAAPSRLDGAVGVDERRFTLWARGGEAALREEQARLEPDADASTVRLIVRMNPAAVLVDERKVMLAAGSGEAGNAEALQARLLAAKASAVAATSQAVLSRSVLGLAPQAKLRQQFSHALEGFVLAVPAAQAEAVAAELARNPAIDSVEPDRAFTVGQTAPAVRALDALAWGVDRIDQRGPVLDRAFRQPRDGSGVNVYVVDTGISPHAEFGSRLVAGFSAINDGRGTVDCNGHGTHVAGTAAGSTMGVAPGARVVPVRVMTCAGSSTGSSVLSGLDWIASQGKRPAVVNLSLGGPASASLDAAAQRLMTLGFSVVAAAGNDNRDACQQSPGRAAGSITVAASDRSDAKAPFSNWGSCVALWAPGVGITAASFSAADALQTMNGTSMAAPHVAGAAALLLQASPTLAPARVREQLLAQATANVVSAAPAGMTRSLLYAGTEAAQPVTPPPPAVASAVLVQSLALTTRVPTVGNWQADAVVTLADNLGKPVAQAQVSGRFSNSTLEVSCTTDAAGRCTLSSTAVPWATVPTLGVAITQVRSATLAYTGGGVRNGQVARPEAPQASVSAIGGTMLRTSPTAANWVPQFTVTVRDTQAAPVAGATVLAVLRVHIGANVFGLHNLACQTSASGACTLTWSGARLDASHTGATVQIVDVQRSFLVYRAGALTSASVGRVQ